MCARTLALVGFARRPDPCDDTGREAEALVQPIAGRGRPEEEAVSPCTRVSVIAVESNRRPMPER
jgi:hypothetical protein